MTTVGHVTRHGKRAKGMKEMIKHLKGERLTRKEAMLAHCFQCMGYFSDGFKEGAGDCGVPACPLYQYFPYRRKDK